MDNLVCAPVLIPLATAIAALPLSGRAQQAISLLGALANLLAALALFLGTLAAEVLVLRVGSWGPRIGIVWVADGLSTLMLVAAASVILAVAVCASAGWSRRDPPRALRPLLHLLAMGVNGALLTGDFFNLFVFYEVMLLASFALITSGGGQAMFARTLPYVLVSLVLSALFLGSVGLIYGLTGTVNMAELAHSVSARGTSPLLWTALVLMLSMFAIKSGVVPFFTWLPDSYPAAPLTINALFAGLLTKVGIYTLLRATPLLFPEPGEFHRALLVLGPLTMMVGVLGALGRGTIRGILSFHIVSQIGYIVFGLGLGTSAAFAAAMLFTVHNMIVKPALILAGGVAERRFGTGELKSLGGLARNPWTAAAFFVPAMALAGLPPLSGFWGKFLLIRAGFHSRAWTGTLLAILTSLLTLASMLKIWSATYWGGRAGGYARILDREDRLLVGAALGLSALAVAMGFAIGPLLRFSETVALQIEANRPYLDAVLGPSR